jgi:hypothetical protein
MGTIWNGSNLAEDMFVELNRAQPLGADVFWYERPAHPLHAWHILRDNNKHVAN